MSEAEVIAREPVSVIILAAGEVFYRLPSLMVSCRSPALIPIHTKPVAQHLIEFYAPKTEDVFLIVDEETLSEVVTQLGQLPENVKVCGVKNSRSVGATLAWALQSQKLQDEVVVNVTTTLPVGLIPPASVGAAEVPDWQLSLLAKVAFSSSGGVAFFSRPEEAPEGVKAFTGLFRTETATLRAGVKQFQSSNDLVMATKSVAALGVEFQLWEEPWIDCGHDANLPKARANLITSRSFNSLVVDGSQRTIRKTSFHLKKIRNERDYYQSLPSDLEIHFPRLRPNPNDPENQSSYVMEYFGYPNLAELSLCWELPSDSWWNLFEGLSGILSQFRETQAPLGRDNYLAFFIDKTERRIEEYLSTLPRDERKHLEGELSLNGKPLLALDRALQGYRELVSKSFDTEALTVFHGDLCFNNILYGWSEGIIRLIDPRGSFDNVGIYGDFRYDLAKINHSACESYDRIVANRFRLSQQGSDFELTLPETKASAQLSEMMKWLLQKQKVDETLVQGLTGGLFLSMCPLHAENPIRQKAFFLQGRRILTELFGT